MLLTKAAVSEECLSKVVKKDSKEEMSLLAIIKISRILKVDWRTLIVEVE